MNEKIDNKSRRGSPKRILFIRLQAMGDVMITLPYILGVKKIMPDVEIDFLTREETKFVPDSIELFSQVHILRGGRSTRKQAWYALLLALILRKRKYDVVVDLQNNRISRIIMYLLSPASRSSFDRFSPVPAGVRTANAIEEALKVKVLPEFHFSLTDGKAAEDLLKDAGWNPGDMLVVLNPAGFFTTRNWPLDHYVKFARLWHDSYPTSRFLILGIDRIKGKAVYLQQQLGPLLINLVGKTSPADAFGIIQKVSLVISEDSGLMHMAWISGKATIALFGSSRSDWSRPLGDHSVCLNSADMECGECMQAECKFGDVRCLTRFTPEMVFEQAKGLLKLSDA